jgi:hypothetical protein
MLFKGKASFPGFENPGNVPTNRKKGAKTQKTILRTLPQITRVLQIQKL